MTRVLLADRDTLFRAAVGHSIDDEPDLEVVAYAGDGWEAAELATSLKVDVVVLDTDLPERNGIDTCGALRADDPGVRVLILSQTADPGTLLKAVEAGASGYAGKDTSLSELINAIRAVAGHGASVPPTMLSALLRSLIDDRRQEDVALARFLRLTRRERDVLVLIVQGRTRQEIAATLYISEQTARTHVQNVLRKLEVHSRLEASILATEHGFIERFAGSEAEQ